MEGGWVLYLLSYGDGFLRFWRWKRLLGCGWREKGAAEFILEFIEWLAGVLVLFAHMISYRKPFQH